MRTNCWVLPVVLLAALSMGGTIWGQGGGPLICNATAPVAPSVRGEGFTEATGDILISCTGGTAIAQGGSIPPVDITIAYNTQVTSRLSQLVGNPATSAGYGSEALLLIDEPGSGLPGYGASLPQTLCNTPLTGCTATIGAVPGPTLNQAVSSGTTPAPNVYQGIVISNIVTFHGIPLLPPGLGGSVRVFRITNVRVNANPLAGGNSVGATPISASVTTSGATQLSAPVLTVGKVQSGLVHSVSAPASLSQCSAQTKISISTLTFGELFPTAFKTRVTAQSASPYAGQTSTPAQNIPGQTVNSESDFVFPLPGASFSAGLADYGTRFKATFNNVPAGAHIFVSTANVVNGTTSVAVPTPIGGNQANSAFTGYAQLVSTGSTESISDGIATFPAILSTDNAGGVPIAELAFSAGTGSAVWEVLNTNPNSNEDFRFAVYVTYATQNFPLSGDVTVNLSFAPGPPAFVTASGASASTSLTIPRFIADANLARTALTVQACHLTVAESHTGNFSQGQSGANYTLLVSNQTGVGTPGGTVVSVNDTVPAGMTLASMAGSGWTCVSSTCTRSDALAAGATYPAITATVNVAAGAPSPLTNSVSVSGGWSGTSIATDSTVINASPTLSLNCPSTTGPVLVNVPYTTTCTASGTSPFFSIIGSLPAGITLTSTATAATITGKPITAGAYTFTLQVRDTFGQVKTQAFNGTISPQPAVSNFSATPVVTNQSNVVLSLASAPPIDLTGTLSIAFTADASVFNAAAYQSEEVQFSNQKKTLNFTVKAGGTAAVSTDSQAPNSQFGVGTVAGKVTLTMTALQDSAGNSVLPAAGTTQTIPIGVTAPLTSNTPQITTGSDTVTVVLDGITSTRKLASATFTFNSASGQVSAPPLSFTSGLFLNADQSWFSQAASFATGGAFSMTVVFPCTSCSSFTGVQVSLN